MDDRLVERLRLFAAQKNPIDITHTELANHVGTAREVVSRLLKQLEMDGKVKLGTKQIGVIRL